MRALPIATILFLFSTSIPFSAQAVSITNAELPSTIQACITSGSCLVNHTSGYNYGQVSAFAINDYSTRSRAGTVWGSTNDWLVRYDLVAPSSQTNIDNVQTQAFDGSLWMRVNSVYLAAETGHPVTVFLDKVTPVPYPSYSQYGDLSLFMTTADLLAGALLLTYEIIIQMAITAPEVYLEKFRRFVWPVAVKSTHNSIWYKCHIKIMGRTEFI